MLWFSRQKGGKVGWRTLEQRTIRNHEEVDAQHGESFADLVVGVLKFTLHDRRVDLDHDYTGQAG